MVQQKSRSRKLLITLALVLAIPILLAGALFYAAFIEPDNINAQRPLLPLPVWDQAKFTSEKNPYRYYERAMNLVTTQDATVLDIYTRQSRSAQLSDDEKPVTETQVRNSLTNVQPAIIELRAGAALSTSDFVAPYKPPSLLALFAEYALMRNLARVTAADANWQVSHGKSAQAVDELLALLDMGNDLFQGPALIGGLAGIAIDRLPDRNLHRLIGSPSLTAADYHHIARELARLDAERPSIAHLMAGEYYFAHGGVLEVLNASPRDAAQLLSIFGTGEEEETSRDWPDMIYLAFPGRKSRTLDNFEQTWQEMIKAYGKPYPVAISFDATKSLPENDLVNRAIFSSYSGTLVKNVEQITLMRGLLLMAALEAYRLERKSYPASLQQLVAGGYLAKAPTDPFTADQPFSYKLQQKGYLLYSVGADLTDNGGKVMQPFGKISAGNPGDIVFAPGLDLWKKPRN